MQTERILLTEVLIHDLAVHKVVQQIVLFKEAVALQFKEVVALQFKEVAVLQDLQAE